MENTECLPRTGQQTIRADRFTTLGQAKPQQFAFWRNYISPLFEISRKRPDRAGYFCVSRGYDLGDMHFASCAMDGMDYARSSAMLAHSRLDHWCISVLKCGRDVSRSHGQLLEAEPGMLQVRSLAKPFEGRSSGHSCVSLFLSRDRFPGLTIALDGADHCRLDGVLVTLLKDCMLGLEGSIRRTSLDEVPLVVSSLTQLISAAIKPSRDTLHAAQLPIAVARFDQARRLIEANLSASELSPVWLCKQLGVSRRQLYYLFEQHGGVSKFILQRRLVACCRAIAGPGEQRLISTIAYEHGFLDPALFSRQFYAEFGFRPSEAREARLAGHVPQSSCPGGFAEWLMQMRDGSEVRQAA